MRQAWTILVPALAALLAGSLPRAALRAEEPPVLLPTRDVDITYSVTRAGQPRLRERVRWLAADQLERMDGPDGSATIFDRKAREITLLTPKNRTYRKLEGSPRGPIEPESGAALTRGGEAKVAGLRCTEWSWNEDGRTRTVCATPDGVLLRLTVDGRTVVEALAVRYHKQKPDLFEAPPGYDPALAPEGTVP